MHLTTGEAFLLLGLLGGLLVGAVATVVNAVLIVAQAVIKIPLRLAMHLAWWAYYALPWMIHWTGLYHPLAGHLQHMFAPTAVIPHYGEPDTVIRPPAFTLAMIYLCTIPFVAIAQFIHLMRNGLKYPTKNPTSISASETPPPSLSWIGIRYVAWSLPVLIVVASLWQAAYPVVIPHKDHLNQIKQVGLALKLYAGDNQGMLPQRLEDMMPTYFTKRELLDHIDYVVPGANLAQLPPRAVIARRPFPEDHLVSEVHADMSAEAHKL